MSLNCDLIIISFIYGQFGAIQKPSSGGMVCKTYTFIHNSLLSLKNWKAQFSCYCLSKGTVFAKNMLIFCKNNNISKIEEVLVLKGIFWN